jgi:hypothetical protein
MENDLDIFRRRDEKKKKNKKSIVADYQKPIEVIFLGEGENGEAKVFSTDGNTTKCLSTQS